MEASKENIVSTRNRYGILASGMVVQLFAGILYLWSVFRVPVAEHLNWDPGAASRTSSIMLATFVLGIILGGRLQDKLGPKIATLAGGVLFSLGLILTAFVKESAPWLVYITYATLGGVGVGTVYIATIAAVQKWFPDRRGFASGMIVSSFGISTVLFTPVVKAMLDNMGVSRTFLIFGVGFLVVFSLCALALQNPCR